MPVLVSLKNAMFISPCEVICHEIGVSLMLRQPLTHGQVESLRNLQVEHGT